jgi:hypothetical protein
MLKWFAGLTACFVVLCAGIAYRSTHSDNEQAIRFYRPPRLCLVCDALANRNSSGSYSTPNTFVTGTTINTSQVNANFADLASEMTDSLDRSGKGGMLAALRGTDGTVAAPAYSWTSETGSGLYRIGAGDLGWSILGTKKLELTASLFWMVGDATLFNTTAKMRLDGTTMGGGLAGIWAGAGASAPTSSNYILAADGAGNTSINSATTINLNIAGAANTKVTSAGLTVGSSGTAISASFAGSTSWTPSAMVSGQVQCTTITTTGASVTGVCMSNSFTNQTNAAFYCYVTANTCNICWTAQAGITPPAATYYCRVFNP